MTAPCVRCRAPTTLQPCYACQQLDEVRAQTRLLEEQNRSIERAKYPSDFDYRVAEWTPWVIIGFSLIFGYFGATLFGLKETVGRVLVLLSMFVGGYVGYKLRNLIVLLGMLAYLAVVFGIIVFIIFWFLSR